VFLRRCAFIASGLVLALYLLRHPTGAAHSLTAIFGALASLADALAAFCRAL
jgi:hypothetical protein